MRKIHSCSVKCKPGYRQLPVHPTKAKVTRRLCFYLSVMMLGRLSPNNPFTRRLRSMCQRCISRCFMATGH